LPLSRGKTFREHEETKVNEIIDRIDEVLDRLDTLKEGL
jgi:hypothetical protein